MNLRGFVSELRFCDLDDLRPAPVEMECRELLLLDALVLGLGDYMRKSGFQDCVLGISGGLTVPSPATSRCGPWDRSMFTPS
jgi:NAD+ synthase (glutamine-hydrolysing)